MDATLPSVAFDFTPADLAEVTVRHVTGTRRGQRARRQCIWALGIVTGAGSMLVFLAFSQSRDTTSLLGMAFTALILGGLVASIQASKYEAAFKKRVLCALVEQIGTDTMRCEVELRREGTWLRQRNVEITHAWTDLVSLADSELGIELRFRDGYMLVRARAFPTPADRATFVTAARRLARDAGAVVG